jgi:hypothetical protein
MIVILMAYLAGWFFAAFYYTPLRPFEQFPEIARGHTCVHLDHGQPAYMVLERGEPVFYDLWTNRSIGTYYAYTDRFMRQTAYRYIQMTSPVYCNKTLFQIMTESRFVNRTVPYRVSEMRTKTWWNRCVRHYQEKYM